MVVQKATPISTAEQVDATINQICEFHGFRREKWDDNKHVVFGLRGQAGHLALSLITALKFTALNGRLPTYQSDFEVLRDLLLLVGRELPKEHFDAWSKEDRRAVEKWATACHLRASDNKVRVPREPQVAQVLPEKSR